MIYYFKAIKSLVDIKKRQRNSLTSYPGAVYLWGSPQLGPEVLFPATQKKGAFWFCWQSLCKEIMEKDKKLQLWFFSLPPSLSLSGKAFLPYDRCHDKWHIWKSVVAEDSTISSATNRLTWPFFLLPSRDMQLFGPPMHLLFVMQKTI